jgi:adenylate cyclase
MMSGHAAGGLEGQRRQVTVLFADMADYTPLAERIGEEAVYALMRRVIERMSEAVHDHQGTVQTITGDGLSGSGCTPGRWSSARSATGSAPR